MTTDGSAHEDRPVQLRLLLIWGYHRAGWIAPFEALPGDVELHYLFHVSAEDEEDVATQGFRHYWGDAPHADAMLDRIRPDRIVFMSLASTWSVALNQAARRRAIPTFVMEHGVLHHPKVPLAANHGGWRSLLLSGRWAAAVAFALRSYGWRRWHEVVQPLRMMVDSRRHGPEAALRRHRFDARLPTHYIVVSPRDAEHFVLTDQPELKQITAIGLPEFDGVYRALGEYVKDPEPLVVLIDSPNAANRWDATSTSIPDKQRFLLRLAHAAEQIGLRFVVKLHPESYGDTWLPEHENVEYKRDTDVAALLCRASLIVGFDSTLVVPVLHARPTLLVRLAPHTITDRAEELGAAHVVDTLEAVHVKALTEALRLFKQNETGRRRFAEEVAYKTDGCAVERLHQALLEPDRYFALHGLTADQCGASHR